MADTPKKGLPRSRSGSPVKNPESNDLSTGRKSRHQVKSSETGRRPDIRALGAGGVGGQVFSQGITREGAIKDDGDDADAASVVGLAIGFNRELEEIHKVIRQGLMVQKSGKEQVERHTQLVTAHKKMIHDTFDKLSELDSKMVRMNIGDRLLDLMPEGSDIVEEIVETTGYSARARSLIARHHLANQTTDIVPTYKKFMWERFDLMILRPAILWMLQKRGLIPQSLNVNAVLTYLALCHKVLALLNVRGVFELLMIIYRNPSTGVDDVHDDIYINVINALTNLCMITGETCIDTDTVFTAWVERMLMYDWSDLSNALKELMIFTVGVFSVETVYPGAGAGIGALLTLGASAIGMAKTSRLVTPEVAVIFSSLTQNHSIGPITRLQEQANHLRAEAAKMLPALVNPPPVDVQRSVEGLCERMALAIEAQQPPPQSFFVADTLAARAESVVCSIWNRAVSMVSSGIEQVRTPPVLKFGKNTFTAIGDICRYFVTRERDTACVKKGNSVPTNVTKTALVKRLYHDLNQGPLSGFDELIKSHIKLIAEKHSFSVCELNETMVELMQAFHAPIITAFGVTPKDSSQTSSQASDIAVAGTQEEVLAERAETEVTLAFLPSPGEDMFVGGDPREVQLHPGSTFKPTQEFVPNVGNVDEFKRWAANTGAPEGHGPWYSVADLKLLSPVEQTTIMTAIRRLMEDNPYKDTPPHQWTSRLVGDMPGLDVALARFAVYLIDEKRKWEQRSKSRSEGEVIANVDRNMKLFEEQVDELAPCGVVADSGSDTEDEDTSRPQGSPLDPSAMSKGGKSRTHRRRASTAKRTRRKAYNKKSNKRKSRKQLSRKKISRRRQSRRK